MMYTIYKNRLEELEKTFKRYAKKAENIGLSATLEITREYTKEIPVYKNDYINHVTYKDGKIPVDVVDVEINFPDYRLGNYSVVAVIDHGENGNLIYSDVEIPMEYHKGIGICEHCRTRHNRKTTVLLSDEFGNFKQVGTTCLKEYTGISDISLVNAYRVVESLLIDSDISSGNFTGRPSENMETVNYLEKCIHVTLENGYNKDNKEKAMKLKSNDLTDADRKIAEKVMDFFGNNDFSDNFLENIKVVLSNDYCKPYNGFVAYAYTAYLKAMEKAEKEKQLKEEATNTEYYGKVGDKITVEVTGKIVGSYETSYGYYGQTVRIWEFTDAENHVFVWKTSSFFAVDNEEKMDDEHVFHGKIKATIKEHSEYRGKKQTVITRVKAV